MQDGAAQPPQHGHVLRLLGPTALVALVVAADVGSGDEILYSCGTLCIS